MDDPSRLAEVVRAARSFYAIAERDCYEPATPGIPEAERRIAEAAAELAFRLDLAEAAEDLPVVLGKRTRAIRRAFTAIVARFGWLAIVEPDRDSWIADRWERFDSEVVIPYLRAVRAWFEDPDSDPPAGLSFAYQEAIRRDLSPATLSAEQAAAVVPSLRMRAGEGVVFADRWPEAGPHEYQALLDAIRAADLVCLAAAESEAPEPAPLGPPVSCTQGVEQESPKALAVAAPPHEANPFPKLSPPGKALAAAYDLKREGRPVSIKAATERAGVNRSHLIKRYPEAVRLIKALGTPDGRVPRGSKDRQTGTIEAANDDED
ncbi:hypothetical protein AB1L88_17830 [Tautonia sp. JC769]|uniref:hypothetical protein n=1 Tax=Tautonia sp. JC769 TaxID=3232135 RepID=UPI00345917BD